MKKLIMIILFTMLPMFSYAEEAPEYMKDGTIVVTLKSGKTYEYSTNEWMVVRRRAKIIPVDLVGTSQPHKDHFNEELHHKNRLMFLGGFGPTGLKTSQNGNTVKVETDYGVVGGMMYQRSLNNRFSLGAVGFTNGLGSVGLGYDF